MMCPGLPSMDDVLLVEGLTANIISISRLYDQDFHVNFNHSECIVIDKHQVQLMKVIDQQKIVTCGFCKKRINLNHA